MTIPTATTPASSGTVPVTGPQAPTRPRRLLLAGTVAAAAAVLAACGSADVTRPRLEASLAQVFPNYYVQQQALLGHPGLAPAAVQARPTCHRGSGPTASDTGAGSDWICVVDYLDGAGKAQEGKFELKVNPNACYTAGAPTKLVGAATIQTPTGRWVTNPVFEFDGCFDPTR
ncbi:MAG TPA: hypothetical protein VI248_17635 [Kineosporiaceae bacterium]